MLENDVETGEGFSAVLARVGVDDESEDVGSRVAGQGGGERPEEDEAEPQSLEQQFPEMGDHDFIMYLEGFANRLDAMLEGAECPSDVNERILFGEPEAFDDND